MRKLLQGALVAFVAVALPSVGMAEGSLAKRPATPVRLDITGKPGVASPGMVDLETGKYYNLIITSDGGDEVSVTAPEFLDSIYLNQISVGDAEIRMWGSTFKVLEVGEHAANRVEITLVPIKPGDFTFSLDGKSGGTFHVH